MPGRLPSMGSPRVQHDWAYSGERELLRLTSSYMVAFFSRSSRVRHHGLVSARRLCLKDSTRINIELKLSFSFLTDLLDPGIESMSFMCSCVFTFSAIWKTFGALSNKNNQWFFHFTCKLLNDLLQNYTSKTHKKNTILWPQTQKIRNRNFVRKSGTFFHRSMTSWWILIFNFRKCSLVKNEASKNWVKTQNCSSPRKSLVKGERFIRSEEKPEYNLPPPNSQLQ